MWVSRKNMPSLPRRLAQSARRSAIHCWAWFKTSGSSEQLRTLPIFLVLAIPHASKTLSCCCTAGSDMFSGAASSLMDADPWLSPSIMLRRLGSASAWNGASSWFDCLSMYFEGSRFDNSVRTVVLALSHSVVLTYRLTKEDQ